MGMNHLGTRLGWPPALDLIDAPTEYPKLGRTPPNNRPRWEEGDQLIDKRETAALPVPVSAQQKPEAARPGRFGHHPDHVTDFCVEVESIEAELVDREAGQPSTMDIVARFNAALAFRVGGDQVAVRAKDRLRSLDERIVALSNKPAAPPLLPRPSWAPDDATHALAGSFQHVYKVIDGVLFVRSANWRQSDWIKSCVDIAEVIRPEFALEPPKGKGEEWSFARTSLGHFCRWRGDEVMYRKAGAWVRSESEKLSDIERYLSNGTLRPIPASEVPHAD